MGMFSWCCPACGFSIRDCKVCSEGNWMGHAVVLTPGGSRIVGHYDGYGHVDGYSLVDQADEFAIYHHACWELAGKPEFEKRSKYAQDQGFCLSHDQFTVPKPTSPEWFTFAQGWHAIDSLFTAMHSFWFELEYQAHKDAYRAMPGDLRERFEQEATERKEAYYRQLKDHENSAYDPGLKDPGQPEKTFVFNGEEFDILTAELTVFCAKRDRERNP